MCMFPAGAHQHGDAMLTCLCAAVFNALLEVCARTNDEARAGEILSRMEAAGVQPDERTYEAVAKRKSLRSLLKRTFGGVQSYL
jgi:pentatricopeptide repeat protein